MQFILSVSAIEFCMKEALSRLLNNKLSKWYSKKMKKGKRMYLRTIIIESEKIGIIESNELDYWKCILDVRNCLIYNNAIPDKNNRLDLDGIKVEFVQGKMIRGKLGFLTKLTDKSFDLYKSWIEKQI